MVAAPQKTMSAIHKILDAIKELAKGPLGDHESGKTFVPWKNTISWTVAVIAVCFLGIRIGKFTGESLVVFFQTSYAPWVMIVGIIASTVISLIKAWLENRKGKKNEGS